MKIESLMIREVATCRPDETLHGAAHRMWDHDCGCVPVVDEERKLVGMLTDRDICMASCFRGQPLQDMRVADAMSKQVHALSADDNADAALRMLSQHQLRRLPVVDALGRLAGILSLADLARASGKKGAARGQLKAEQVVGALRAICTPHAAEREVSVVVVRPAARKPLAATKPAPADGPKTKPVEAKKPTKSRGRKPAKSR